MGLTITSIIQSSSATTVMTVGFVNAGLITLRQALTHLMFNIFGTIVFSILIYGFKIMPLIERFTGSSVPHQIANMHTTINVVTTIGLQIMSRVYYI